MKDDMRVNGDENNKLMEKRELLRWFWGWDGILIENLLFMVLFSKLGEAFNCFI